MEYKGTWNASSNNPALASGVGTANTFYIVSVAGTTTLNGISNWGVGDWATFNGTVWQRVEGGAAGNFTDLSVSGTATFSGGTANGVAYLNGSKVLTTGSALTFDGTNLAVGSASAIGGGRIGAIADLTAVNGLVLRDSATSYANNDNYILLQNSTGVTAGGLTHPAANSLGVWGNDDIRFLQSGAATELMRLTSTGLGIGTSSPGSYGKLAVQNGVIAAVSADGSVQSVHSAANTGQVKLSSYNAAGTSFLTFGTGTDVERMRLDSSGNLGIGTTNPLQKLVVSLAGAQGLEISPDAVASAPALIAYNRSGGAYVQLASIALQHVWQSGASPSERARITSTGYFKASNSGTYLSSTGDYHELRSSNDNYLLYAVNTRNGGGGPFGISVEYSAQDPNGTGNEFLQCVGISTLRAEIRSNGGLANFSGNNVNLSDRREKTNFAPAKSYLDTICAIPVQTFNYIDQSEDDPGLTLGVVAQDVQAVAPELVMESNWGTKDDPKMRLSIYQTDLQYALMKCIQEQQAIINQLKARIEALEQA
jgi:hypothetical protein